MNSMISVIRERRSAMIRTIVGTGEIATSPYPAAIRPDRHRILLRIQLPWCKSRGVAGSSAPRKRNLSSWTIQRHRRSATWLRKTLSKLDAGLDGASAMSNRRAETGFGTACVGAVRMDRVRLGKPPWTIASLVCKRTVTRPSLSRTKRPTSKRRSMPALPK
jgi:hypothetical protein